MHKIAGPKFSEKIFKAYDIRGKYPEEINEDAAYKIARSYATYLGIGTRGKALDIVVSSDDRPSCPKLKKAFIDGLLKEGVKVVDAGITTTPMHYFIVNKTNADGGAMITASHRPFEYNGLKLSRRQAEILGEGSGMEEIRNSSLRGVFLDKELGSVTTKDFKKEYLDFFKEKFAQLKNYKIKIKIDPENSVAELFFKDLISEFPKFELVSKKYDLCVSFDRDGDRIKFKDEKDNEIQGDFITALLVSYFDGPNSFIYDIRSSRVVKEEIEKHDGRAIESRVGHSFIKKSMREHDAIFAGELVGHYYFRDFFYADSAIFAMFSVVDLIRKENKSLSKLIAPFQKYYATPELNFKVENKDMFIDKAAAAFSDGKISYLDGIKIDYPDWWFILRLSNTEDLIRLRVEANTPELLEEKKTLILKSLVLV